MTYRHIALMGRAGSGKDTVARRLVERFQFTPVAVADPLRETALRLDPIIGAESTPLGALPIRLSDLIRRYGWDRAKREYPEVRRTLQRFGEAIRTDDPDYWLRMTLDKIGTADRWGLPVVITDVRHPNEADSLRCAGALMVRIDRPGTEHQPTSPDARQHISETALADYPADAVLSNAGTLAELHQLTDRLAVRR
ncbi:hypothetical protein GCM10010329_85040 [Streptomyces spiroverticillatus]|uniref:Adenylate kinase n=1 Tax=Streptomyces finlayi TaxID=67296 RepID=A0A919CGD5_9ACTN|nr:hypothetical protein [Streptomyces finlayi]GHA49849.1 hypothetical protein GCM10010329_85040 [Streptomyces spiroverticillatus]GHD19581.1 hypothetical protein GCM10010334_83390 [Streptomyces finlayi]